MTKRKIYSAIAALTLLSATSAASAASGTINLTGSVESTTCTVSGLNQSVSFPPISVADLEALNNYQIPAQVPVRIDVTACPTGISKGIVTMNWTAVSGSSNRLNLGSTKMRGAAVMITKKAGDSTSNTGIYNNGDTVDVTINNGTGSTTIYPAVVRSDPSKVVADDFTTAAQLTMSFQ